MQRELELIYKAVLEGDARTARLCTGQALDAGLDPLTIVQEAMMPAMKEVGRRFECHDYFVPELLLASRAMKTAMEIVQPRLGKMDGLEPAGRIVIGTVKGDLHDLGKNLVAGMLEGSGYEVLDLGVNVPPERFVMAVQKRGADILAMSALLTTTMPAMKTTIDALQEAGIRGRVKVLVGGAPVSREYAMEIGADGYGDSAATAVSIAKAVTASRK